MSTPLAPARAAAIRRRLLGWWDVARRELPWRFAPGKADPYRVWVSEAMLQQTQVATVIPYYRRFLRRFPTLRALARAEEEQVLAAWSGLGYYSRARALHRAAREALARFGGLPRTLEELRSLPGVGPYTAGAVASIAFGVATPAVDGNVGRVLSRLFLVVDPPHGARFRTRVWGYAGALVGAAPAGSASHRPPPGELNQALIELGALLCRPREPRCDRCPLEPLCGARRAGREGEIPVARRRASRERLTLAVGVCLDGERVLLVHRPASGLFARMWAPPAVELRSDEDGAAAISTAIRREPSARTGEFVSFGAVKRTLTHRILELRVFVAPLVSPLRGRHGWRLADADELRTLPIPEAMRLALRLAGVASSGGGARKKNRVGGIGTRAEKG